MITGIEIVQRVLRAGTNVEIVRKVPTSRPDVFVRVDSSAPKQINVEQVECTIIVQVYADDLGNAVDLAHGLFRRCDRDLLYDPDVSSWDDYTLPYDFPDPEIPQHRWQFTGQLIYTPDL